MVEHIALARAAQPLPFTGERMTSAVGGQIEVEHLHRYLIARDLCRDKDVLDIASGEGYGSALLAQTARGVVGVEIDPQSVAHASASYVDTAHSDTSRRKPIRPTSLPPASGVDGWLLKAALREKISAYIPTHE